MEAGKPVIIQKPMCISVSEADRIIEIARRTGTKVGTFHTAHTSEWDALQVIRSGALGDLMRVSYSWHASRGMAYYNSGPWRGTWKLEGSGVLSNQCIHDINRLHAAAMVWSIEGEDPAKPWANRAQCHFHARFLKIDPERDLKNQDAEE